VKKYSQQDLGQALTNAEHHSALPAPSSQLPVSGKISDDLHDDLTFTVLRDIISEEGNSTENQIPYWAVKARHNQSITAPSPPTSAEAEI
jgi:hypothetical protein